MTFQPGIQVPADYPSHLELEADVCIIGAGAGGCAAAAQLAAAGKRVLVLEEGRHWLPQDFRHTSTWAFRNLYAGLGTRATRGNCLIPLPGGRGVGGSTLINSAICFRTPPSILKEWREQHGCTLFDDAWMGECFDRIWTTLGVGITRMELQGESNLVFARGAEALQLKGAFFDRSAPACTACARCQQGCPSGGKYSADRTFLAQALMTGTVAVYPETKAAAVETDGRRITAVTGSLIRTADLAEHGTFRVKAAKFLLAAGAIGSPRFLLQNGLSAGPVGQNLHIHPTSGIVARFAHEIRPWQGVTQGYYVDCWDQGFLLQTFSMPPDQHYITLPLPPDVSLDFLRHMRYLASVGVVLHDIDSTGSVGDGTLTYHMGDQDRRTLLAGMRLTARTFFAAGALEVAVGIHKVGLLTSPDQIDAAIHDDISTWDLCLYASHPMGTCRMGKDVKESVCGADGRVWEWDNLWVSDASVFPTSLGVNPQVTVMAIGLTVGREMGR